MAEQEACANAVTEALGCATAEVTRGDADGDGGDLRGESLLLPLLQGLLGGGGARLAAGLGAAPPDVAADVRRALARLRTALQPPAAHPNAAALLALADRLEDALQAADADRLDGVRRRPRRRARAARHTVGVTRGELDEARRLVDDLTLPDTTSSGASTGSRGTDPPTPDRDREPSVVYHAPVEVRSKPAPVVHSISYEGEREREGRRDEPATVERRAPPPRRPDFFRHSVADTAPPPPQPRPAEPSRGTIAAMANKFDVNAQMERRQPAAPRRAPGSPARQSSREEMSRTYFRPLPPTYNFAAPPSATQDDSKPLPRDRASRKLRMKRANTIDIGRSLGSLQDAEDDRHAPIVPDFRPQTENDKKFVAFMRKNEIGPEREEHAQANWSNRFGNIKHAFESRETEREDTGGSRRSSSASSAARRFWRAAEEAGPGVGAAPRSRSFYTDSRPDAIKPPWVTERREPPPRPAPAPHPPRLRTLHPPAPPPAPALAPLRLQAPPAPAPLGPSPPIPPPQSPTRHLGVKQFVARPIPMNQFSHAPMSAFKPPTKVASPTTAPLVWSPPSTTAVSPAASDRVPGFPPSPRALTAASPPAPPRPPPAFEPPHATHAHPPPAHDYPVTSIPSVNGLAAPELVRRADRAPHVDAQRLQIEFYERQIREKRRREAERKPPPPPPSAYTVTDFTPPGGISTFVPLQRTPDIEKTRVHKVDYLPDVVTNEAELPHSPAAPRSPRLADLPPAYRNGDILTDGHGHMNGHSGEDTTTTTEHEVAVTRVMRGPVRGAATITAGARSRGDREAADALRGALVPRPTSDHHRRKPHAPQVRALGRSPPSLGASRESVVSSESTPSVGSGLSRSGSWHQMGTPAVPGAGSPRRLAVRTKSMHLLAVPKLFEGGIARDEITDKKRTVEAYFAGAGGRSPTRARGGQGAGAGAGGYGLGRSRTVATLSELQFLDESNADVAFEDLVSALA